MQNRWKSYILWGSVVALVLDVLIYGHVITVAQSSEIQGFVQRILEILVVTGVINNPTSKDKL